MRIAPDKLSAEALQGLIEAHVLREGTDYGHQEFSFADKCAEVRLALDRGGAEIWFDAESEAVMILPIPRINR